MIEKRLELVVEGRIEKFRMTNWEKVVDDDAGSSTLSDGFLLKL